VITPHARMMAKEGADIVVADVDEASAQGVGPQIKALGRRAIFHRRFNPGRRAEAGPAAAGASEMVLDDPAGIES
jgi:hypothetical protein